MQQGYFAIDFTFDDIEELRAKQVLPFRDQKLNDQYKV